MVGIGASAGGLQALEAFFASITDPIGAAFVVVTHQAPARTSALPALLARCTTMPVVEVRRPTAIRSDHVYVMAAGGHVVCRGGRLEGVAAATSGLIAGSPMNTRPVRCSM